MSTELTLDESIARQAAQTREQARETLAGRGAEYGQPGSPGIIESEPVPQCRGCGTPLEAVAPSPQRAREVSRVVGDNDGHVDGCPECIDGRDSGREINTIVVAHGLARKRGEGGR